MQEYTTHTHTTSSELKLTLFLCVKQIIEPSALHRDDSDHALKLLQQCEKCVEENLVPILKEEPTLRSGTFSSVLEEYVEGILFYTWLQKGEDGKPLGRILMHHELKLSVSPEEYLGGLCDLSGEIGRFAVSRGTKRDRESVKLCLDTNKSMHMALRMVGKMPGGLNKKMFALSKSVEKLERVMYELSLMEMTGREFASAVDESSRPEGNHQNNDED